jgi:hypothetical protein
MTTARTIAVGAVLAALVLGAPFALAPAAEARVAPPRCPRSRPADGTACRRTGMTCSYAGAREGDHDFVCTCVEGHTLTWTCVASGVRLD